MAQRNPEISSSSELKTTTSNPSEMGELAQRAALSPQIFNVQSPDGAPAQFAVVPDVDETGRTSVRLVSLKAFVDEYREKPVRRTGVARMLDPASLIGHINRFKDEDSAVFADTNRTRPSLTAVLDYHKQGASGAPRFGVHRSQYAFPLSVEWEAWTKANGADMDQVNFAEFIEDHLLDVIDPKIASDKAKEFADKCMVEFAGPSKLLELSRGLSINVGVKLANQVNLQSGEKQIQFEETHTNRDGKMLKVPGAFLIGIPVFRADARYEVCVRLRYRTGAAGLTWCMDLWRHEEVFDHAILQACELVKKETGLPLFVGTPEG